MIQQFKVLIIDCHSSGLSLFGNQSIGLLQSLVEHVEEPFHGELVHLVDLVKLCDCKVEICGPYSYWSVHGSRLLEELLGVIDLFKLVSNRLSADLALFQDFNQLIILQQ